MSKFKIGQKVVSSERGYNGLPNWPIGTVIRAKGDGSETYGVRFGGDDNQGRGFAHFEHEITPSELETDTPSHYTPDSTGKDYLARCEDTFSREEMIGAYRFTLGKYVDRMGKKTGEPVEKELAKIIDYATRAKARSRSHEAHITNPPTKP